MLRSSEGFCMAEDKWNLAFGQDDWCQQKRGPQQKIWWKLTILCQLWWSFAFFSHSFWRWLGIHHFEKGTEKCTRSSTKCSLHLESRCSCCNWNSWNIGKNRYGYRSLPIYSSSSFFGSSTVHNLLPWNSAVHKPFQTFPDSRTSSRLIHYDSDERRGRNSWNWCIQCIPQKSCLIWGLETDVSNVSPKKAVWFEAWDWTRIFLHVYFHNVFGVEYLAVQLFVKALLSLAMTTVWKFSQRGLLINPFPQIEKIPFECGISSFWGLLKVKDESANMPPWNRMKQHETAC